MKSEARGTVSSNICVDLAMISNDAEESCRNAMNAMWEKKAQSLSFL
jgi:hypothetical protein